MKSPDELEIERLEKEYAKLSSNYESINSQIEGELNADNINTLEIRRSSTLQKITTIWGKLEELKRSSNDEGRQYLTFKEDLPKIDFSEVIDEIEALSKIFKKERGDALLILQESLSMSGDLCLERIRDEFKRGTGNFIHYELEFHSGESLNKHGWLEKLGRYFGFNINLNPEELAKSVIEKICEIAKSGSTFFLEIRKWDDLPCQKSTLSWFIEYFWKPLVYCLDNREKYPRVKFIAAIVVEAELSDDCFSEEGLCRSHSQAFRWLELPLRNWTQDEIQEWLECYPGIGNPRSINLSQRFFKASRKGIPSMVCQALEKELLLTKS